MAKKKLYLNEDDRQQEMEGIDTDLSQACSNYLHACAEVAAAIEKKEKTTLELIGVLRANKRNAITYKGYKFTIKKGHVTKESIQVK